MKNALLVLTAILISCSMVNAQQYFDNNWNRCSQARARYIVETGTENKDEHIVRTKIKDEVSDSYSIYKTKDFKNGEMVHFSKDGDTLVISNYLNGKMEGDYKQWKQGHGLYKTATYRDGEEDGITEYLFPNGIVSARYMMKRGKRQKSEFWNEDGSQLDKTESAYIVPGFKGKDEKPFVRWVSQNLVYPQLCKDLDIEGTVMVSFTVGKDGKVRDAKVIDSPHYMLSLEAIRVIMNSPPWTPGKIHNQISERSYTMPVIFRIVETR